MDITTLYNLLTNQLSQNQHIILDETILSNDELSKINTALLPGNQNLTLDNITSIPQPKPGDISINITSATADLLNCKQLSVSVQFQTNSPDVEVIIIIQMDASWVFKNSFPNLTLFPFSNFQLDDQFFIYSTVAKTEFQPWLDKPGEKIPLQVGLNFAAWLSLSNFSALTALFSAVVKEAPSFKFYGPFSPGSSPYPVTTLTANPGLDQITIDNPISNLTIDNPTIAAEITEPQNLIQNISLSLQATMLGLDFVIAIREITDEITISASPQSGGTFTAENIINYIPGGSAFQSYIPTDLIDIFQAVGLQNFTITMNLSPVNVSYLSLSIGTTTPWNVIPGIVDLTGINLNISTIQLGTSDIKAASISATAQILPKIFTGNFEFDITLQEVTGSGWEIDIIGGYYYGSVLLSDIIKGIVGDSFQIPKIFQDLSFSDFYINIDKESGSYSCCGSCEFTLTFGELGFYSAASINITYSGGNYDFEITGEFLVGEDLIFNYKFDKSSGNKSFTASLQNAGSYSLQDFLNKEAPELVSYLPQEILSFQLNSLSLSYDSTNDNFQFQAELSSGAEVIEGVSLNLNSLNVSFTKEGGTSKGISVTANLQIDSQIFSLTGTYSSNVQTSGWTIQGKLSGEETISLTDLINSIVNEFNISLAGGIVPDLTLSNPTAVISLSSTQKAISFGGTLNINGSSNQIIQNLNLIIGSDSLDVTVGITKTQTTEQVSVSFSYAGDLTISLGGDSLTLTNAGGSFVFAQEMTVEVWGNTSFSLCGNNIDTKVTLSINETEAIGSCVVTSPNSTFTLPQPAPQGIHFNEFGVELGIIFEPPGIDFGLSGAFTIGTQSSGPGNNFAVIVDLEGDVPVPLYISFYFSTLNLSDLVTIFTNSTIDLGFPVSFTDPSFYWCDAPGVILPDGTTTSTGYGFSGFMDIFGFNIFAQFSATTDGNSINGLTANAQMDPLSLGNILTIAGDGAAIQQKCTTSDNKPVKNNIVIPGSETTTEKTLVNAGGAAINFFSSEGSGSFSGEIIVSFLDWTSVNCNCKVNSSGINFSLENNPYILNGNMAITLTDSGHFTGTSQLDANGWEISVNSTVLNLVLGSITLNTNFVFTMTVVISDSNPQITLSGSFSLGGTTYSLAPFTLSTTPSSITDIISAIQQAIIDQAPTLFADLFSNPMLAFQLCGQGLLSLDPNVIAKIFHADNYGVEQVAKLMNYRNLSDLGQFLYAGGYPAAEVASAITSFYKGTNFLLTYVTNLMQNVFNVGVDDIGPILNGAGFNPADIASAMESNYSATATTVVNALKNIFTLNPGDMVNALLHTDYSTEQIMTGMQAAGYQAMDVAEAMAMDPVDPKDVARALNNVYNKSAQEVAAVMKNVFSTGVGDIGSILNYAGFNAPDVAGAMKSVYNAGIEDVAQTLKTTFGLAGDAAGSILKGIGFSPGDVTGALKSIFGLGEKIINKILHLWKI